jgi:hypothetical protein
MPKGRDVTRSAMRTKRGIRDASKVRSMDSKNNTTSLATNLSCYEASKMTRVLVAVLITGIPSFWSCAVALAQAPIEVPYARDKHLGPAPEFAEHINSVAEAIGLPPLREVELPKDYRELRLWNGFGIAGPFSLLRIIVRDTSVKGEMFKWGDAPSSEPDAATIRADREIMRRLFRCPASVVKGGVEWCEVQFPPDFNWKRVLERLEVYRVWSLPDQRGAGGHDGFTLVVEARVGAAYRTYDYWITDDENPDEQDAAALGETVFGTLDEEMDERKLRERRVASWCNQEISDDHALILHALGDANRVWSREYDRGSLTLIQDEALCQQLAEALFSVAEPPDYLPLYYEGEGEYIVIEIGVNNSVAEGCVGVTVLTGEFRAGGIVTVCD